MDGHASDECSPMKSIGNKKIDNKIRSSYGKEIIKKKLNLIFK
jgi:catabolite regulation protein CreA